MTGEDLILRDEAMFFDIVSSTPDLHEAEDLLRRAKAYAARRRAELIGQRKTVEVVQIDALFGKLNSEIHDVCIRRNQANVRRRLKEFFGEAKAAEFWEYVALHDRGAVTSEDLAHA